jgi:hypothetical protein
MKFVEAVLVNILLVKIYSKRRCQMMEGPRGQSHLILLTNFVLSDKIGRLRSQVKWATGPLDLIAGGLQLWLRSFLGWVPPIAHS